MQVYSDASRESDPCALPDVEVFYISETESKAGCYESVDDEGWYFWYCLPGCLPASDPIGPFNTRQQAVDAAQTDC